MFKCAWCKKENITPSEWSEHKEPLCSECVSKYRFSLNTGMITGKISELPKEQRREISEAKSIIKRFGDVANLIRKEVLIGRFKILSDIIGLVLFLFWAVSLSILREVNLPDWFIFRDAILFVFGIFIPIAYGILIASLFHRINWCIKFWQLKKRAQRYGYRVDFF